jgi:hypothetical protein
MGKIVVYFHVLHFSHIVPEYNLLHSSSASQTNALKKCQLGSVPGIREYTMHPMPYVDGTRCTGFCPALVRPNICFYH